MFGTVTSFDLIEDEVLAFQDDMWNHQCSIWPGQRVYRLDCCDPWAGIRHLGWEVQEGFVETLQKRLGYQLGGFVDRPLKLIGVSDKQSRRTQRFTLAHELGHALLHTGMQHHREIPMHGLGEPREPVERKEREANHFAGVYLVPTRLLRKAFVACFGVESLTLTDRVAQDLLGEEFMSLLNAPPSSLAFERLVAQTLRFGGRQFDSLVNLFQVHPTTLAIRLRDCGLTRR
jgi:hypothetical protein